MGQPPIGGGGSDYYIRLRPGDAVIIDLGDEGLHVSSSSKKRSVKIRYGECKATGGHDIVPVIFEPQVVDVITCRANAEFKVDGARVVRMEPRA